MDALLAYQKEVLDNLKKSEKNYKKTPKDRLKKPYLETRLDNLEQLWITFKDGHKSLIGKVTVKDKQDTYFTEDMYEEFEELYVSYKTLLKEALQPYLASSSGTSSVTPKISAGQTVSECEVKLPRVQLPTFSGKYVEWQSFYDMFNSLVHTNKNLSPVQKLHYLKSNLSGEPETLLRNFSITNENYDEAWKQLLKRYDNKRYNCNALMRLLFTQKPVTSESPSAIKHLLDTTTTCLQSLRNMDISAESINDAFVIYLVVSKLDPESIKQWEYQLGVLSNDLPTWTQLSEFLESKFRSLEMIDSNKVRNNTNTKSKSFHGSIESKKNNSNMPKCSKCKGEHYLYNCKEFSQLSVKERQDYVKNNNLCFNCFSPSHPVIKCRNSASCKRCGRRHHSLLHFEKEVSSESTSEDVLVQSESDKTFSEQLSVVASSAVMFRFVTLLCLVAPVFSWFWDAKYDKGLKVRYDVNPLAKAFGNAFMDLPQTRESAKKMEWTLTPTPELHEEFASLEVWCSKCSNVCVLLDDTGYVAGVMIAFKKSQFTTPSIYDWKVQGFRNWTTIDGNGKSAEYIFTAIYFSSPEYLKTSAESRLATRNPDTLLQDKYIYVSGINGELHPISTDPEQIADTAASNFTLQACMPWMGNHYYYEMRESLECNSRLFPFFPLEFGGKLIGLGYVGYGVYEVEKGCTNFFENPPKLGVQTIVPRGPACLYDLANNPGLITMHTYFIDSPTSIYCLPKLG